MEVQNTRTLAVLEQALTDTHTKPTGDPHVHDWPQTAAVKLVKERSRGQVRPPPPPPPPPPLHHHLLLHLLLHLLHHLKLIFTSASRPSCLSSPSRCRAWAGRKARRGSRVTRSPCSSRARSRGRSSATRSGRLTATAALMYATQGSNPVRADFARDHNPHVAALRTGLLLTRVEPRPGQEHVHFATVLVVDAAVLPGGPAATLFLQLRQVDSSSSSSIVVVVVVTLFLQLRQVDSPNSNPSGTLTLTLTLDLTLTLTLTLALTLTRWTAPTGTRTRLRVS